MTSPYDDVDPERQYRLDHLNKIVWALAYSLARDDARGGTLEESVEVHLGNSVSAEEVLLIGEWAGVMEDFVDGKVDATVAVQSLIDKGVLKGYAILAAQTIAEGRGLEGFAGQEPDDDADFSDFAATRIEQAILREGDTPNGVVSVTREFMRSDVLVLDATKDPDKNILMFLTLESDDGTKRFALPVFTREETVHVALAIQPDWAEQYLVRRDGGELLNIIEDDMNVVINPYTEHEFYIPARDASAR